MTEELKLDEGLESKVSDLLKDHDKNADFWWEEGKLWFSDEREARAALSILERSGYNVSLSNNRQPPQGPGHGVAWIQFSPISQKQVKSQIKDSILGDLLDRSSLVLYEGWMKHPDGVYSAEISELSHLGRHPNCPKCRKPVNVTRDLRPQYDGEQEVTSWKGAHDCGQKLEVFND